MNLFQKNIAYLKDNPEGYWFKRKLYGWGWVPAKWQGWAVIAIWLVLYISGVVAMGHELMKILVFVICSILLLIYICYKKGEKPKWQWGVKK